MAEVSFEAGRQEKLPDPGMMRESYEDGGLCDCGRDTDLVLYRGPDYNKEPGRLRLRCRQKGLCRLQRRVRCGQKGLCRLQRRVRCGQKRL